jgi:lipopolysaccharide export system permease protein
LTTLDRHLLMRFLYASGVFFIAALGLYVVVDGFINLDDFQHRHGAAGVSDLLKSMGWHYLCQSSALLEMFGATAAMMGVTTTLALMSKHGELHPLLAAGVPTYRLAWPFIAGMLLVNGLLIANQELVMPRIASQIQSTRGGGGSEARQVESCLSASGIFITGESLYLRKRLLEKAEFRFSPGALMTDFVSLTTRDAYFLPAEGEWPAGWWLREPRPLYASLPLTEAGRQVVVPLPKSNDLFIITEVTFEELYNRSASFKYLGTPELFARARKPATATGNARSLLLHLHGRFLRPAIMIASIFVVFPVLLRRESRSLVSNIALCTFLMAVIFGLTQGLRFISQSGLMSPELASWLPLLSSAGIGAWLSPVIKT